MGLDGGTEMCPSRNLRNGLVEEEAPKEIKTQIAFSNRSQQHTLSTLEERGIMGQSDCWEDHTVLVSFASVGQVRPETQNSAEQ